jgi:cyclopropane fatty-acyl-phospholipid synthase-like methyltransferase
MACFSAMEDAPIAGAYRFPSGARVVDIGGGQGGFLTEVLRGDPSLRGLLFDLPAVVEDPRVLREAGLLDRCELVGGDFFDAVPTGGDVYVLKRVLHDWDDATCVDLLTRCRAVVPDDGRLLVIDAVIPPGNDPHPAKIVDMVMMSILPGRERTEHELADLFSAAGFRLERVIPTHSMLAIAEGVPS